MGGSPCARSTSRTNRISSSVVAPASTSASAAVSSARHRTLVRFSNARSSRSGARERLPPRDHPVLPGEDSFDHDISLTSRPV
ncbi:hypothetical protein GCM10010151_65660 [Actinoallomurus spadix]|uniref:Uncharacterized protein n=1 Tax=Actinoallomurus spadix TaxID=79912 RepID=A0ABN0XKL6_9ACTN